MGRGRSGKEYYRHWIEMGIIDDIGTMLGHVAEGVD